MGEGSLTARALVRAGEDGRDAAPGGPAELCVVLPILNEEDVVPALFERLMPVLDGTGRSFEVVCVDDGSTDGTVAALRRQQARWPQVEIVSLSRNFGKEAAISAGIDRSEARHTVIMDADLQHPPEVIPAMLVKAAEGFDMVYGVRAARDTDGPVRRVLSQAFYASFGSSGDVELPPGAGDFRVISARALRCLKTLPERRRFMKGLYAWIGFTRAAVPFEVEPRAGGRGKWSLLKLASYGWTGLLSFSTVPLRVSSVVGLCVSVLSVAYAGVIVVETFVYGRPSPGYATVATAIFFLGGIQLLALGILGEYVGRIFEETKGRPVYLVQEVHEKRGGNGGGEAD